MFLPAPRGLRDPNVRDQRVRMLGLSKIAPLKSWALGITQSTGNMLPEFDPADGGVNSKTLILHGWISSPRSGMTNGPDFLSVDNDSDSAEVLWRARMAAGLHQGTALHWRVIPWYLDDPSSISRADVRNGSAYLLELIYLLPKLETVVLCGDLPCSAWAEFIAPFVDRLTLIETVDAYAAVKNRERDAQLRADFERAAKLTL